MNTLLVLAGLPGVGKTTLLKYWLTSHPEFQKVDVFSFVRQYLDDTGQATVPDYDIRGYRDLYAHLFTLTGHVALEIGTNFPRLNMRMLRRLNHSGWNVIFVLCLLHRLDVRERHRKRGTADRDIPYKEEYYSQRIHRNFPGSYIAMCAARKFPFHELDMTKRIEENSRALDALLCTTSL